jgi:hypothetical protein
MTTITHPSQTIQTLLPLEVALAARIIRAGKIPHELWQWLVAPATFAACKHRTADVELTVSLNEILAPMLADAHHWERQEARYAASWLGAISRTVAENCAQLRLGVGPRLLAASLLPLYRSLATGHLSEGFRESRTRLSELLSLLALCHEVGDELVQLLDPLNQRMDAPNLVLSTQFDLNLVVIAQVVREQLDKFDVQSQQFDSRGFGELVRLDKQQATPKIVDWAVPELLWKLSGELISQNSELVLPRCWIETPVPWSNISDHWNKLSMLLSRRAAPPASPTEDVVATQTLAAIDDLRSLMNSPAPRQTAAAAGLAKEAIEQNRQIQLQKQAVEEDSQGREAAVPESSLAVGAQPAQATPTATTPPATNTNKTQAAVQPAAEPVAEPVAEVTTSAAPKPVVIPKVLIAEIRSHNDPVFVNVIRRQISKCRTEDRALALVSMVVLPEDGNEQHAVRENGLTLWQQRLVNWLADHPHVVEPHAFLTSEGELLLCLLDLERNEMTSLVRHGLVEVLTGQQVDDSEGSVLAKVNVPARYHAGIACTSSPGASFTAEQLIEPAVRCLSAASRHGKASIKSIEVF